MAQYSFVIRNQQRSARYPKSFDLADADAARGVAQKIARVFAEVVPYWETLSPEQQRAFVVEIADEAGQVVLTVPFSEAPSLAEAGAD